MKKLLLVSATLVVAHLASAQSSLQINTENQLPLSTISTQSNEFKGKAHTTNSLGKSTAFSDTLYRVSTAQYDSLFTSAAKLYFLGATPPLDSGLVFGTNAPNWSGYAGRFTFSNLPDTTLRVLGVLAVFSGNYVPSTTKSIDFKVWGLDPALVTVTSTRKMKNLPGTALGTALNKSIKNIGIGLAGATDTINEYYFAAPITNITTNFFVGYEMNYQWANLAGDTVGAYSCTIGQGWGHGQYTVTGPDTIINAQTAVKDAGVWKDSYIQLGFDRVNMSIVPIFQYSGSQIWPSDVKGITQNNLTFFGNYPNPTTNEVNVKFSLQNATSVNVYVRDITGKTVINIPAEKYAAGEHVISFATANLAAGNYVYVINTADGDAMAAQITVAK